METKYRGALKAEGVCLLRDFTENETLGGVFEEFHTYLKSKRGDTYNLADFSIYIDNQLKGYTDSRFKKMKDLIKLRDQMTFQVLTKKVTLGSISSIA